MCPPASISPAIELGGYSPEEEVCKTLTHLKSGHSPPANVLTEVDPYQFSPSNLPEDMWYFWSGTKRDAENGFWRSTGEACEIYSSSMITGSRKTLRFYEGRAPNERKTNWMMQEYTTTDKHNSKPDSRALYRVFLVDDSGSGRFSKSELLEKVIDDGAGPSKRYPDPPVATANQSPDPPAAMANLEDCLLRGDYISMDDLDIPLSRTTSSADSSCVTGSSGEFFDIDDLMRDLGDDPVDQQIQDPRVNLNLSAPAKLKQVVVDPSTLESVDKGQTSKTDPTPQKEAGDDKKGSTSHANASSSSSSSSSEGGEKKDRAKKRKMMKFLCFLAF